MTAIERAPARAPLQNNVMSKRSLAERRHLRACFRREVKSDPRYRTLSPEEQQVLSDRIELMDDQGEIWLSQEKTLPLIRPLGGGRPSQTGHISKPTLNAKDAKLEESGLLWSRWSEGKIVTHYAPSTPQRPTFGRRWDIGRTPKIKVWALDRTILMKAWGRFNAWLEEKIRKMGKALRSLRRPFYTDKAKAYLDSGSRSSRHSSKPSRSSAGDWRPVVDTGGGQGKTLGDLCGGLIRPPSW
jgi:hypothetical protein